MKNQEQEQGTRRGTKGTPNREEHGMPVLYIRGSAAVSSPVNRLRSESSMPIHIRRHDNKRQETQVIDSEGSNADLSGGSTACYIDRKPNFRALCGSI